MFFLLNARYLLLRKSTLPFFCLSTAYLIKFSDYNSSLGSSIKETRALHKTAYFVLTLENVYRVFRFVSAQIIGQGGGKLPPDRVYYIRIAGVFALPFYLKMRASSGPLHCS